MTSTVQIDLESPTPHYEQLRAQLAALIGSGQIADGERLPTVRALANDLGIAPGTVARAYRDLESDQLVITRRKIGTRATAPAAVLERAAVHDAALEFARVVVGHGVSDKEARDLLAAALVRTRAEVRPANGVVGATG